MVDGWLPKPRQGVLKNSLILKYCLSSGTKTMQDCQSQQLQQALEMIRRTLSYETRKRATFALDYKIKSNVLNFLCTEEPRRKNVVSQPPL